MTDTPTREPSVTANEAAERAAPPALDCERLALALVPVTREVMFRGDKDATNWRRKTAAALIAEYNRIEEYQRLIANGLSDAEARGTVWPEGADQ